MAKAMWMVRAEAGGVLFERFKVEGAKVLRALGKEMQLTVVEATRLQAAPRAGAKRDALKVMQKRKRCRVRSS